MNINKDKKVNLKNVIQLDQLEQFLTYLLDKINKQDDEIIKLNDLCRSFATNNYVTERFLLLNDSIKDIYKQLEQLQVDTTANLDNRDISSGELSSLNYKSIININETINQLVKQKDYQYTLDQLQDQINKQINKIYSSLTPIELSNQLQLQLTTTNELLTTIEQILPNKINRNELIDIQVLYSKLKLYNEFIQSTDLSLTKLSNQTNELFNLTNENKHEIVINRSRINDINDDMMKLADRSIVYQLEKIVNDHNNVINTLASKSIVDEISNKMMECEEMISKLTNSVSDHNNSIISINDNLLTKANNNDLKLYVPRKHYEQAITALGTELDTKSSLVITNDLMNKLNQITTILSNEQKKISITMRFVDWFTERGVSYEHNLQVIDKHMNNLVQSNKPIDRLPYNELIRYTTIDKDIHDKYKKNDELATGRPINNWNT